MTERNRVRPRHLLVALVLASCVVVFVLAILHRRGEFPKRSVATPPLSTSFEPGTLRIAARTNVLVIGGGGDPDSSEVQLEAETILARDTFAGPSLTLFAGGAGRFGVREDASEVDRSFRASLGALFLPRPRAARVRTPSFSPDGASTYENVTEALGATLAEGNTPLIVVLATHGQLADGGLDAYAMLWGNDGLFVDELAQIVEAPENMRPSRFLIGSCHGGAFARAIATETVTREETSRSCGFFATTGDRLASGCDGDPDRSRQRSYLLSFMRALRDSRVDGDHDGRVSMLEAHVAAASTLESFDVPITTSEYLIREAAAELEHDHDHDLDHDEERPAEPAPRLDPAVVPESAAIAAALSRRLGLSNANEVRAVLDELSGRMHESTEALAEIETSRDTAWNRLRVALLERFPWLEDAYAPGWEARVERERASIEPLLMHSDLADALAMLEQRAFEVSAELDTLRVREAMLARLLGALEFPRLLADVKARSPEIGARYESLRACERFVPTLGAHAP